MNTAAVILAAGASTRMGRPKMLLDIGGRTVLDRAVAAVAGCCDPVIVVLGHDAGRVRAALSAPATIVVNPDPDRGQLSSLQCGLRALPDAAEAVLFMPGDYYAVRPATAAALRDACRTAAAAIPRFAGRHGHPVAIRRELVPELLAETVSAREFVHRHLPEAVVIDTDDAGVLRDLDTPEDYAEARG